MNNVRRIRFRLLVDPNQRIEVETEDKNALVFAWNMLAESMKNRPKGITIDELIVNVWDEHRELGIDIKTLSTSSILFGLSVLLDHDIVEEIVEITVPASPEALAYTAIAKASKSKKRKRKQKQKNEPSAQVGWLKTWLRNMTKKVVDY